MTTATDPRELGPDGVVRGPAEADDSLRHELTRLRPHEHVEAGRLESALAERMFGITGATTRIGRFDILGRLGSGGMGVVYSAYDPQLQRHVALKILRDSSRVGRAEHQRLLREALALARIKHPNVVTVHEVGPLDDDQVFLVMEFVEGQNLHAWARAGEHDWREVLAVYLQAGRGLAAAHAAGFVHRDFKPHNAIIGADGRVRVVDFGLARDDGSHDADDASRDSSGVTMRASGSYGAGAHEGRLEASITRTDAVLGTPAYMSPEQWECRPVGAASDQWSFCVALYEGLVGARPFEGDTREALAARICSGVIAEPPRGVRVPAWLLAALRRGMRLRPADRFGSMDELLAALERDPSQARRRWLWGAVLTALGGTFAVMLAQRASAEPCAGSRELLADTWGPTHRAALVDHLGSLAAPASTEPLLAALDGYAAGWQAMHEEACLAGHDGAHSDAMLDKRMVCLAERRAALEGAIEVLGTTTTAEALESAAPAIHDLPAVERCGELSVLEAEVALPEDLATRAAVSEVREQLARASLLADVGRFGDAHALAVQGEARAQTLRYPPLSARARLVRGRIELELDDADASRSIATLDSAFYEALAIDEPEVAVEARVRALYLEAIRPGGSRPSDSAHRLVQALLQRLPEASSLTALFLNNAGAISATYGDFATARGHFDAALAALEAAPHPLPIQLADTRFNAAVQSADALAQRRGLAAVAEQYEHLLGPSHHRTLLTQLLLARAEPDPRAALARYDVLCEAHSHHPAEHYAKCLYDQGLRHREVGELEEAAAVLEHAARLIEPGLTAQPPLLQLSPRVRHALAHGQALACRGRHAEVVTELRAVSERLAAFERPLWMRGWLAELDVVLGEALLATSRPSEAIAALEPAVRILDELAEQRVDPSLERTLARARLALARAHLDAPAGTLVPASPAATGKGLPAAASAPQPAAAGSTGPGPAR